MSVEMNFSDYLKIGDENPLLKIDMTFQSYLNSYNRSFKNHIIGKTLDYAFDSDFAVRQKITGLSGWGKLSKAILANDIAAEAKHLFLQCNQAGPLKFPEVYDIAKICSERLELNLPIVFVREDLKKPIIYSIASETIDPCIIISSEMAEICTKEELTLAIGCECGKIQNNHSLYNMACAYFKKYYSEQKLSYNQPVSNQITFSLQEWINFGDITADRAGMMCCDNPADFPKILSGMYNKEISDCYGRQYENINLSELSETSRKLRTTPARDISFDGSLSEIEKRLLCAMEFLSCENLYRWRNDAADANGHYVTGQVCDVRCSIIMNSGN